MKVLGYIRVSSKTQIKGYSLNNQRNKIKDYCKYMDYDLVEYMKIEVLVEWE